MDTNPNKKASSGQFSSQNVKSPSNTPEQQATTLGGIPPKKGPEEISKENSPNGRGRAPGAVGF